MATTIGTEPLATPAAPALTQQMTYEEFLAWADGDTYTEWVNGKIVYMSPVSNEHQAVGLFLLNVISCFVEAHNLGIIRYDPVSHENGTQPARESTRHPVCRHSEPFSFEEHVSGRPC
jgi:Uma2 family endonuclease